ncbi:interaptin-like isoform X1 [Hemibagrus wyckioides]|uniref:interaptin-like isoform X1 n=1 Tax=Hemibagrus wyckioides TaxID=337641 RepID=UPI00266C5CC7|nr:interaptin-like isoform X1 [Hemibagrus wyckioides]XP_058239049.1 interaptin-like isoform X1 [Hemibagrus wyckioides]
MKKLHNIPDTKPVVLVVLHHTFNPEYDVRDSNRSVNRENMITVDCLFYEDSGLLQCQKNNEALNKTSQYLKKKIHIKLKGQVEGERSVNHSNTELELNTSTNQLETLGQEQQDKKRQLEEKTQLSETNKNLEEKESLLTERETQLIERDKQLQEKDGLLEEKTKQLQEQTDPESSAPIRRRHSKEVFPPNMSGETQDSAPIRKNNSMEGNCPTRGASALKTKEPYIKFWLFVSGRTLNSHKHFIAHLKKQVHLQEVSTEDECDFILGFCPTVSRSGTDIEAAMKKLHNIPDTKPVVLVVLHHTFNPECVVPDSSRSVNRENMITVDCLFHEDSGLLQCQKNNDSLAETLQYLEKNLHIKLIGQVEGERSDKELETSTNQLEKLGQELQDKQRQLQEMMIIVEQQKTELTEKSKELEEKESLLTERDTQLMERDKQLQEKDRLLTENTQTLIIKDETLEEKEKQVKEVREELEKTKRMLEKKQTHLENKEKQLESVVKELETSKNKLIEKDEQLQEKDRLLTENTQTLQMKDETLEEKEKQVKEVREELEKTKTDDGGREKAHETHPA